VDSAARIEYALGHFSSSMSERARSVGADRSRGRDGAVDRAQNGHGVIPPAGDESREPSRGAARDEQVNVFRPRGDGNERVRLALAPDRQASVVDLTVAVIEAELAERVAGVRPEIAPH